MIKIISMGLSSLKSNSMNKPRRPTEWKTYQKNCMCSYIPGISAKDRVVKRTFNQSKTSTDHRLYVKTNYVLPKKMHQYFNGEMNVLPTARRGAQPQACNSWIASGFKFRVRVSGVIDGGCVVFYFRSSDSDLNLNGSSVFNLQPSTCQPPVQVQIYSWTAWNGP